MAQQLRALASSSRGPRLESQHPHGNSHIYHIALSARTYTHIYHLNYRKRKKINKVSAIRMKNINKWNLTELLTLTLTAQW